MKKIDIGRMIECCEKRVRSRNFTSAHGYAEPGYDSPESGIVFGNWNPVCGFRDKTKAEQERDPVSKLYRVLERAGCALEWEDEWSTCGDCGKAVRTSGDCYGWTPYFRILNDCELFCLDCLDVGEYLESIEDNPLQACAPEHSPEEFGYVKYNGDFETGLHPGQNDSPALVLSKMHALGMRRVVFKIDGVGQFDARWQAFHKTENKD